MVEGKTEVMGRKEKKRDWIIVDRLADLILMNVEGCVVDIGIGASTDVLTPYAQKFRRRHFSCDISRGRCEWATRELKTPEVFLGTSENFIKQFPDIPVALLFIDGDHRSQTVMMEVEFFLPKMPAGAVIFLHDTYPIESYACEDGQRCGTVYRVRQKLEKDKRVWTFTWPYTAFNYGLTMVMKKNLDVPFCRR